MRISEAGLDFTASNEGFSPVLSPDNGHEAIAYGHDVQTGETFNQPMTEVEGRALLRKDFETKFEPSLNRLVPSYCTQNQFDALADFAYNEGAPALGVLLSHGWGQVPEQLPRWCWEHVNGVLVKSDGLLARRMKEGAMFKECA